MKKGKKKSEQEGEITVVSSEIQAKGPLKYFDESVEMMLEISNQVKQIKVVDETSLSIANQKMSFVNNHIKLIEEKRVTLKEPYLKAGKDIDSAAKELKSPLEEGLKHLKDEVGDWNRKLMEKQAELKRQQDQEAAIAQEKRITDYIKQVKDWFVVQLDQCKSAEHAAGIINSIKGLQPAEMMGKYASEYTELVNTYNLLFINKRNELTGLAVKPTDQMVQELGGHLNGHIDNIASAVEEKHEIAVMQQEESKQEIVNLESSMATNVRYNWKFEVIDVKQVPFDFLCVDEAKVKEYIKNNKDILREETVNGIRFYKDMSVVTK